MEKIQVGRVVCFIEGEIGFLTSTAGYSSYQVVVYDKECAERHQALCLGWQCCAGYHTDETLQQIAEMAKELGVKKLIARKVGAKIGCLPAEDAEDISHWRIQKKS